MEQPAIQIECEVDEDIIKACQQGDRLAFQQLFNAYKDRVYSIALHFSGDESLARDITQNVFLKIFTSIKDFHFRAGLDTWLYRIVVNECLSEQRRFKRFIPFADMEMLNIVAKESPEENYWRQQLTTSVRSIVASLNPKLRLPILLRYVEGLSYDEIAQVLGCSKGTVASRLNRGHKILARKLVHLQGALGEIQ
ncbi:MAG: sigma-70 family RNA polymerase sigma factor [Acidobacteriota bacterium]